MLREYYRRCRALIFPGEEDFGIVPLEAQACGAPVIAFGKGGARETVVDLACGVGEPTGVLFPEPTVESLRRALYRFEAHEQRFNPAVARAHALRFSRDRSRTELERYLGSPTIRQR